MATADDYANWIVANPDKKGTAEFDTVAAAYAHAKANDAPAPSPTDTFDPSAGGGSIDIGPLSIPTPQWLDRGLAGAGKAVSDTGLGLKQLASYVGIGNKDAVQKQVDQTKIQDTPLMNTGAGTVGNILGQVGMAVGPGAVLGAAGKVAQIPKLAAVGDALLAPTGLLSSAASGAAQAGIQPVQSGDSRIKNMLEGGAAGAVLPAVTGAGGLVKNILSPLFQGGQEQIAGRTLQRFATDPNAIANATATQLVPGSMPTLAEATGDIGLSQLQRTLRNNPDANSTITQRLISNQDARQQALDGIAGSPGQRDFFAADRSAAAKPLYEAAFNEQPTNTPWVQGQITQLMKRPTFQDAWNEASNLALDDGLKLDPSNMVQTAHYAKMALDQKIESLADQPTKQQAVQGIRDKLVSLMESKDFAPSYAQARQTYAAMSKPINQMDVGQALSDKMRPALAEFGATGRVNAAQYAQAVRDSQGTASRATGFPGATLENTLAPDQLATVQNVAKDLGRSANAANLGLSPGSPTAQNLISQDIVRQVLGPLGLPGGALEGALADNITRPLAWAYKPAQDRVLGMLGGAVTDPAEAKRLVALANKNPGAFAQFLKNATPYAQKLGTSGMLGLSQ